MNRFIQKTTSVILSLATVALIGAPAFAAYEPQEALNDTPAVAAEAVAEPTEGRDKIETTESGKEEAAQAQTVETASAAAEETEEEPTEEKPETETAVFEETPDDTDEKGGSELPEISKEDIENILRSDEVINALEEAGIDGEEIEDIIENEEYEVIYVTKKEFEKMRRDAAMEIFEAGGRAFLGGIVLLLLLPASPILFLIPFLGQVMALGSFASPLFLFMGLKVMVFDTILTYAKFELKEPYVLIEE